MQPDISGRGRMVTKAERLTNACDCHYPDLPIPFVCKAGLARPPAHLREGGQSVCSSRVASCGHSGVVHPAASKELHSQVTS